MQWIQHRHDEQWRKGSCYPCREYVDGSLCHGASSRSWQDLKRGVKEDGEDVDGAG